MQLKCRMMLAMLLFGVCAPAYSAELSELLADQAVPKVKILSEEYGIAQVLASDIIALRPEFKDVAATDIHVFSQGQQIRVLLRSQNGVFDDSDTLLFETTRRSGEGQYYDIEGRYRAYIVVADATTEPLQYATLTATTSTHGASKYLHRDIHLEQDKEYFLGFTVDDSHPTTIHRTEYVQGEGWYWKQFLQLGRSESAEFDWFGKPDSDVEVTYGYATLSDAPVFNPDHYVAPLFNGDTLSKIESNGYAIEQKTFTVPSTDLNPGKNSIGFASLGVPISKDNPLYTDVTALDFFRISGESTAELINARLEGRFETEEAESRVQLLSEEPEIDIVLQKSGEFANSRSTTRGITFSWHHNVNSPHQVDVDGQAFVAQQQNASLYVVYDGDAWRQVEPSNLASVGAMESAILIAIVDANASMSELAELQDISNLEIGQGKNHFISLVLSSAQEAVVEDFFSNVSAGSRGNSFMVGPGNAYVHELVLDQVGDHNVIAVAEEGFVPVQLVEFVEVSSAIHNPVQTDAVIITHSLFMEQSQRLAAYRRDKDQFSVVVVDVESLYNWYNHGEKSPQAIKDFLTDAYENWPGETIQYVVLMGDASWDPRQTAPDSYKQDFVPSFGKPVSDYWYTLLDGNNIEPEMAIGRITVETAEQAEHYIDKVIEYEGMELQSWMKEFLLLAGGNDSGEFSNEQKLLADFARQLQSSRIESAPFCATADTLFKQTVDAVTTEHALLIRELVNQGKLWVSYMGHSAPTIFDMDFGTAEQLNNPGKYPVLATYSCQTGAFAEPNVTAKNEDYVRIDNKGFVGAYGTTGFGEAYIENNMRTFMFDSLRFGPRLRRLGDILVASKMSILSEQQRWSTNPYNELPATYYNVILQQSLLGDPMVQLRLPKGPELLIEQSEITVVGPTNELPQEGDSIVYVRVPISNAGLQYTSTVTITIEHAYDDYAYSTHVTLSSLCGRSFVEFQLAVNDQVGSHKLNISIAGEDGIEEENQDNNVVEVAFDVATDGVLALDPLDFWNIDANSPTFRVANPRGSNTLEVVFAIENEQQQIVVTSQSVNVTHHELYTDWHCPQTLVNGAYVLSVVARQNDGIGKSRELRIPFHVLDRNIDSTVTARIQGLQWQQVEMENFAPTSSGTIALRDKPYTIEVMSNAWFPTRWTSVKVEETGYSFTGIFDRGFNLFQFRYVNEDSTWITRRRFDTWEPGNAGAMVEYLRDSVAQHDLIVMNTHGSAWRGVRMDELEAEVRGILADYGVDFTEKLTDNTAFVMSATPTTLFFADYLQNTEEVQDTLVVTGQAYLPVAQGSIETPTFGPARKWTSLSLPGIDGQEAEVVVYGMSDRAGEAVELGRLDVKDLSLEFVDALAYPFLFANIHVEKTNVGSEIEFNNCDVEFEPTPEYGVWREKSSFPDEIVLQGEDVYANINVVNMSRRVSGEGVVFQSRVVDNADQANVKVSQQTVSYVPALGPSFSLASSVWLPTLGTGSSNIVDVSIGETAYPELYRYNNEARGVLLTGLDEISPSITLVANNYSVSSGDNVPLTNNFIVQVYDNSRQLWNDPQSILIEINGRTVTPDEIVFGEQRDTASPRLLAYLNLYALDIGINRVDVTATDRSGNTSSSTWLLTVDRQAAITEIPAYPNPFTENVTFAFEIKDNLIPFKGTLTVYNVYGRAVRTLSFVPRIGTNEVEWDGYSQNGNSVAPGTYVVMVEVIGGSDVLRTSLGPVLKQ